AEDGIRDFHVTGVQTCALPICGIGHQHAVYEHGDRRLAVASLGDAADGDERRALILCLDQRDVRRERDEVLWPLDARRFDVLLRSEERRVGEEASAGWAH